MAMLERQKITGPIRKFSVAIPVTMCEALDKYALSKKVTRSLVVAELVAMKLETEGLYIPSVNNKTVTSN